MKSLTNPERSDLENSLCPTPKRDETPSSFADRVGIWYVSQKSNDFKKEFGFYLTPGPIAKFMANLISVRGESIRILDPGAGAGILLCSSAENLLNLRKKPKEITLVAYELDSGIIEPLKKVLSYLKKWARGKETRIKIKVVNADFVLEHTNALSCLGGLFPYDSIDKEFDVVISNPPYFKIPKLDPRAQAASEVVHGQPNIYSLFMAIGATLLRNFGDFIFISPRSFASGLYFKLFREKFFSIVRSEKIHVFNSRKDAFHRDKVLQENIILKGVREDFWFKSNQKFQVAISTSQGIKDIVDSKSRMLPLKKILDLNGKPKILRLPTSKKLEDILALVDSWPMTLDKLDLKVSTGPVVPFRSKVYLDQVGKVPQTHWPLFWMNHIQPLLIKWPNGTKKQQYIKGSAIEEGLLISNKNYVFLRRFSSKDDNRRLIAAPYIANKFNFSYLGLENHLNYIHRPGDGLTENEAWGLAALLSSSLLDRYFRIINGNTQVSASEMKIMPFPKKEFIEFLGKKLKTKREPLKFVDDYIVKEFMNF